MKFIRVFMVLAVAAGAVLVGAGGARADVVVLLQRSNLRGGPSLRNSIVGSGARFDVYRLVSTAVDDRGNLWYQIDRDIRSSYWRYAKFTDKGWIKRDDGFPADIVAYPLNGANPIEIRARGVEKQRVKFTGKESDGWSEVTFISRADYVKNKAWVFAALGCRRPALTVERAMEHVAELKEAALPDEVRNWFIIGGGRDRLAEVVEALAEVPPDEQLAKAKEVLLADRMIRLGMTPAQVRLTWGRPLGRVRVEGEAASDAGFEWSFRNLTVRFGDGLVTEIYPGNR